MADAPVHRRQETPARDLAPIDPVKYAEAHAKIKRQRRALKEMNRALRIQQMVVEQEISRAHREKDALYREIHLLKAEIERLQQRPLNKIFGR